jgi:hypothetical protein
MYTYRYPSKLAVQAGITVISGVVYGASDYHKNNRYRGFKKGVFVGFFWPIMGPIVIDVYLDSMFAKHGEEINTAKK